VKSLVAGWFSFDEVVATVGDLMARDVLCEWLARAGIDHDVANAPLVGAGVDWREVAPDDYERVIFVCGPFGRRPLLEEFVERFGERPLVGIDVSMLDGGGAWDPFNLLLARDGARNGRPRPDLSFVASEQPSLPVACVLLAHPQGEYAGGLHGAAGEAIARLPDLRPAALLHTDTDLLDGDRVRSAPEVVSLVRRSDVVVTTRMHGLVLALREGVPAVAIDPIAGGAKVSRQAEAVGWPATLLAKDLSDEALGKAFDWCLTAEARGRARECAARARERLHALEEEFLSGLAALG
jgi:Polysaccharide pyruvyl transferase